MNILNNKNSSVVTALTLMAVAASGVGFTDTVIADSHLVRVDANTLITYNSALSSYRTMDGSENTSWKQSNDNVGEIGGWRTYANEAYQANKKMDEEQSSEADATEQSVKQIVKPEESGVVLTPIPTKQVTKIEDDDANMMVENESMAVKNKIPQAIVGVSHQSATDMHRAYKEVTLQDWKAANDRVREIGGWRTYANEAYQANKRMTEQAGANQ